MNIKEILTDYNRDLYDIIVAVDDDRLVYRLITRHPNEPSRLLELTVNDIDELITHVETTIDHSIEKLLYRTLILSLRKHSQFLSHIDLNWSDKMKRFLCITMVFDDDNLNLSKDNPIENEIIEFHKQLFKHGKYCYD